LINNDFDLLTHQDRIYQFYLDKERWIRNQVNLKNAKLKSVNKPKIILGIFDVIPANILHSPGNDVLLVEHIIQDRRLITKPLVEIPRSVYGIYYMSDSIWHRNIQKDFNCFINRNDPIRQSWFYLLYYHDLLKNSYVSFSGSSRMSSNNNELFDNIHQTTLSSFDSVYQEIKQLVPYKNFIETGNLCDTIMSTKFSIIIETYFERTDAITFSEKTFRALQTPRPWLLFHSMGAVKELRNMGFYVYDDLIDHSYDDFDTSVDSVPRQESILEQAKKLMSMEVTESLLDHWEKMTKQNCKILNDFNSKWQHDVLTSIDCSYKIALETI
jgi:hypothetical protein